jgi:hypothetical protein
LGRRRLWPFTEDLDVDTGFLIRYDPTLDGLASAAVGAYLGLGSRRSVTGSYRPVAATAARAVPRG